MDLTQEDFQKARRISRAIQEHLESINDDELRTTDVYPMLVRKGLIEADRHNGSHFRSFLRFLYNNNLIHLIPQCKPQKSQNSAEMMEWYFYRVKEEPKDIVINDEDAPIKAPLLTDEEIDELIEASQNAIDRLPKREDDFPFTPQQLEIRRHYPRAYEEWSDREREFLARAYRKFGKIDKVAKLLRREPSVVEKHLAMEKEIDLIKNPSSWKYYRKK